MSDPRQLVTMIEAMAMLAGRTLTPTAVKLMVSDLSHYPHTSVLHALERCRTEVRGFPTIADILERIPDGRPGAEEAWAILPKGEGETCVWTFEMSEAYGVAKSLFENTVQARLAFVETYRKLCAEARAQKRPVKWTVSMGQDPAQRDRALKRAVELGRLTQDEAQKFLPELPSKSDEIQISGPEIPADPQRVLDILSKALEGKDVEQ